MQKGYATETLLKRLDGLEKEKREISDAIAKEQLKAPIFSQDHFKMALSNFRKIDITTQEGKRKIIDTFINAIYLYDDHLKILYNANGKEERISLAELESSTLFSRGAPNKRAPCGALLFGVSIQELRGDKQPAGCAGRRHLPPTKQWKPTVFRAPRSSGNSCYPHQDKKSTFSENRKCRLFFM